MRRSHKKPPGYRRWSTMKSRCNNPNDKDWPRYGGRGITVSDRLPICLWTTTTS